MKVFETDNLGSAWYLSMKKILDEGEEILDEEKALIELRNLYITIHDFKEHDYIINNFCDKKRIDLMIMKYNTCGLVGNYKIDYGSYLYNNNGVNQINWVEKKIKNKPETKSATIGLHRPGENVLTCLSLIDFKLRNNKLHMTVVYRSQNIYSSQPGNLLALRQIQTHLAKQLNAKLGDIELTILSAHIYNDDYEVARSAIKNIEKSPYLKGANK